MIYICILFVLCECIHTHTYSMREDDDKAKNNTATVEQFNLFKRSLFYKFINYTTFINWVRREIGGGGRARAHEENEWVC